MAHPIVWLEFVSDNMEQTEKFYGDIFGWKTTPMMDGYKTWETGAGEGSLGGGFRVEDPAKTAGGGYPRTVAYVLVEDIDAHLAKIEAAGGTTIVPKTAIGEGMGSFAIFNDPHGTSVGLFSH